MKINLRPYSHDKSRWHVDIRLMDPCNPERELRRRKVAPAGLSKAQARAWGERQVSELLRKALGSAANESVASVPKEVPGRTETIPPHLTKIVDNITLAEFYASRFEPEHVLLKKAGTQESYAQNFRVHVLPRLGEIPLVALDAGRLSTFRAALARDLGVTTVNLVLAQLRKALRFAHKVGLIDAVPYVEKLAKPRSRPKKVLSSEESEALRRAAASLGPEVELVCLLGLDAGLRASEMCALEWGDVDLKDGTITVQHNTFKGITQTPKGTIGKVALTAALRRALEAHRRREPIGPLVLYRRSRATGSEWRPHTRGSISHALHRAQEEAGLPRSGPHLLRHTLLTRLADLGASVYVLQAMGRHSRLETTQAYIHQQRAGLAREAAQLLDQAAPSDAPGKSQAKRAKTSKSKS
jgi:integrase/recombinase XerC